MPLLRHILALLPGLAAAVLLLIELRAPLAAPPAFLAWSAIHAASFALVSGREARALPFWFLAVPPAVLTLGACAFLFLIEQSAIAAATIGITVLFVTLSGYTHFLFVRRPASYQPYALESLSLGVNLAAFFLVGASSLGFVSLLALPQWVGATLVFGLGGLLLAETLWVSKVRAHLPGHVFVGALVLAEAAAGLLLLPVSYLVSGAALAVLYYVTVGILRAHALGACDAPVVRRYALVSVLAVLAIVGTARWV